MMIENDNRKETDFLPEAFVKRMEGMLGGECEEFLASYTHEKYQALRVNPLKAEADSFPGKASFHLSAVPWAQNGYYYTGEDQPGKHPYHEAGVYYIQEPSAMAPAQLLDVRPGERVLDLCAAPGGKSTQIASFLRGEGLLVCNEIHPARAKILSENVERMGIANAMVLNETPRKLSQVFPEYFDRILVDAPCSGEGMFRKNEEACKEWSLENVALCAERQGEILDCAAGMLRSGGRLVYSTCTFAPAENEETIASFLVRHPEFAVVDIWQEMREKGMELEEAGLSRGVPAWGAPGAGGGQLANTVRLWPHRLKGEGHYAAVLQKRGEISAHYQPRPAGGIECGIPEKDCKEYRSFEEETLQRRLQGTFLRFGDQLYLTPQNMPSVKGLKVLRPGLHLGTVKKNRFEPSHALALFLQPQEAKHTCCLDSAAREATDYLNGLTFPAQGEKGWYLICVDGYSLGWGKLAGGVMKNHYPKGLRK